MEPPFFDQWLLNVTSDVTSAIIIGVLGAVFWSLKERLPSLPIHDALFWIMAFLIMILLIVASFLQMQVHFSIPMALFLILGTLLVRMWWQKE